MIVVPRPLSAAALVVRHGYLIVALRSLPAAPLVVCRRHLFAAPRSLPAAPLVMRRRYLYVVPKPLPATLLVVHRRYLAVVPGLCPRRRSLCIADTWPWCQGRGLRRRDAAAAREQRPLDVQRYRISITGIFSTEGS
jgi:hypothetical protein